MRINNVVGLCAFVVSSLINAAYGASWIVWPGQSVQAAITNAAPGDNITLKEGNYIENITVTKSIDIRGEPGKDSTTSIHGLCTISNAMGPVYFQGFKLGVSTSGNIVITNSTDVRLDSILASPASLTVGSSKLYLYRSDVSSDVNVSKSDVTVQRSRIRGNMNSYTSHTRVLGSQVDASLFHHTYEYDCNVFQSHIGQRLSLSASNYCIAYNNQIRYADIYNGKGECYFVGNIMNINNATTDGLIINNTSPLVYNNAIFNNFDSGGYAAISITANANPLIVNNTIDDWYLGTGIYAAPGSAARIVNNIIKHRIGGTSVNAPATVEVRFNNHCGFGVVGGCTPVSPINESTAFGASWSLPVGSVCINGGDPMPQYNDLDNTRNDVGWSGGHVYDPSGRTTTNPVVIYSSASPLYVKRGQTITLKARGAVVAD